MHLIDTHSHIHFPDFDADRDVVLSHMKDKGIGTIVIGTTLGTSQVAIAFAESHENIWASVGYHPEHFSSSFIYKGEEDKGEYSIDALRKLAQSSSKVVAIGETGLDFYRIDEGIDIAQAKAQQEKGFREQIALAHELDLALVVHSREAFEDLTRILKDEQQKGNQARTIIHCFTGSWKDAQPLLDLGCSLSFSGVITFPPKKIQDPETHIHRVIERMPIDRILIETDAPFLAPVPYRGKRNEPAYVEEVAKKIAELRGISLEEVSQQTLKNAKSILKFI